MAAGHKLLIWQTSGARRHSLHRKVGRSGLVVIGKNVLCRIARKPGRGDDVARHVNQEQVNPCSNLLLREPLGK